MSDVAPREVGRCERCAGAIISTRPWKPRRFCSRACSNNVREHPRTQIADRLWRHVEKRGPDECWLWTGAGAPGHGRINTGDGRFTGTHRVAYELAHGPIPAGMDVCHRCDTPACVNPAHLFVGTRRDNMRDMMSKGRGSGQFKPKAATCPEGPAFRRQS